MGRWARIGVLGAAATAAFLTFPAISAHADLCEDPTSPTGFVECPPPPPVTAPPVTAPPPPPVTSPPATAPRPPATTPTTVRVAVVAPPTIITSPRNSISSLRNSTRSSSVTAAPPATPAPTVTPPAAPETTVAPAPSSTDPPTTAAATPTTAPEIDVQLASGTRTADDLSSGPTLLPTVALVALGGLLFAAGYWFYVTVLGRR